MIDISATELNRRTGRVIEALSAGEIIRLRYGPLVAGYIIPPDVWDEYQALRREREARESK